ncbi:MAG TPA: hypothetical protein EYG91_02825 [Aquifex aeolicus]|nr:hypothetical protein [Aquifex aeolicus]
MIKGIFENGKEKNLIESIRDLGIGLTVAGVVASVFQNNPVGYLISLFGLFLISYGLIYEEKE